MKKFSPSLNFQKLFLRQFKNFHTAIDIEKNPVGKNKAFKIILPLRGAFGVRKKIVNKKKLTNDIDNH